MTTAAVTVRPVAATTNQATTPRIVVRVAMVLFAVQFLALCIWSCVLYSRFSLTHDGAEVFQLLYLTVHGHPGAYSTIDRYPGWRDHFTLLYEPLALVDLLPPHGLWVLWLQDAALVAAEVIAFRWMRHVVGERCPEAPGHWCPKAVLALGCLILVANPWTYWAASWDVHTEPFATPFVLAAAFDFSRGHNRRAWCWVALTLLWGDVMATWVIGLGVSALIASVVARQGSLRRTAALLVGAGLAWLALATLLGGDRGSLVVASSGYVPNGAARTSLSVTWSRFVTGAIGHPTQAVRTFAGHWPNVASVVGPAGWVGILTSWTIGVPLVVILENNISGFGLGVFSNPGYQSAPVFAFSAVGVVILVTWVVRRWRWRATAAGALISVIALNAVLWAVIWIPQTKSDWLRVSEAQAGLLDRTLAEIPTRDEVVASQGIVGRFADRDKVYDLGGGNTDVIPVSGSNVWFIVAPTVGIEDQPVNGAQGTVASLTGLLGARLVSAKDGIWVLRWHRTQSIHTLVFPSAVDELPAWVAPGAAGRVRLSGSGSSWQVAATGRSGYIVSGDYWQRHGGDYEVRVQLQTAVPVWIEAWDDNDGDLLAREEVPPTGNRASVFFPLVVPSSPAGRGAYSGLPPFTMQRVPPVPGQTIEIRIWSPGGDPARIYDLELHPSQQDLSTPLG